jgi:hypothetical protein
MARFSLISAVFLLAISASSPGAELPSSFKSYQKVTFPEGGDFYLAPGIEFSRTRRELDMAEDFIKFEIGRAIVEVGFSPGPSEDPTYLVETTINGEVTRLDILADRLFVSSAGIVYADGKKNHLFDTRRKFFISSSGISEVSQPFLLVGQKCRLNDTLQLTSKRCGRGSPIANLPAGSNVDILLGDTAEHHKSCGDSKSANFLVSTPFGLVGWTMTAIGDLAVPGRPIECVRYHGG